MTLLQQSWKFNFEKKNFVATMEKIVATKIWGQRSLLQQCAHRVAIMKIDLQPSGHERWSNVWIQQQNSTQHCWCNHRWCCFGINISEIVFGNYFFVNRIPPIIRRSFFLGVFNFQINFIRLFNWWIPTSGAWDSSIISVLMIWIDKFSILEFYLRSVFSEVIVSVPLSAISGIHWKISITTTTSETSCL